MQKLCITENRWQKLKPISGKMSTSKILHEQTIKVPNRKSQLKNPGSGNGIGRGIGNVQRDSLASLICQLYRDTYAFIQKFNSQWIINPSSNSNRSSLFCPFDVRPSPRRRFRDFNIVANQSFRHLGQNIFAEGFATTKVDGLNSKHDKCTTYYIVHRYVKNHNIYIQS